MTSDGPRKVTAESATVHAKRFTRPRKVRQTGEHHAFGMHAKGGVTVIVDK